MEDAVVHELRARVSMHGVSMEEEHRRLLRSTLLGERGKRKSFSKMLVSIPKATADEPEDLFARQRDFPRAIEGCGGVWSMPTCSESLGNRIHPKECWGGAQPRRRNSSFLSVLTLAELSRGGEFLRRKPPRAAISLDPWIAEMRLDSAECIFPVNPEIKKCRVRLPLQEPLPVMDELLAAPAIVYDRTAVTRGRRL